MISSIGKRRIIWVCISILFLLVCNGCVNSEKVSSDEAEFTAFLSNEKRYRGDLYQQKEFEDAVTETFELSNEKVPKWNAFFSKQEIRIATSDDRYKSIPEIYLQVGEGGLNYLRVYEIEADTFLDTFEDGKMSYYVIKGKHVLDEVLNILRSK